MPEEVPTTSPRRCPSRAVAAAPTLELVEVTAGRHVVVVGSTGGVAATRCRWPAPAVRCGAAVFQRRLVERAHNLQAGTPDNPIPAR